MSHEPLVSIVTPFYNARNFFGETIESVLAQTHPNWEMLLIDDNSTDGSAEIARSYAARRPDRVRYLDHENHQNKGQSASRNLGIKHAAGEYVAFLDHDDVWLPHKLTEQLAIMEAYPDAGMIYGRSEYWYGWTGDATDRARDHVAALPVDGDALIEPPRLLIDSYPLGTGTAPCTGSLMLRRAALDRAGGFEDSFRGENCLYEDQAFLVKIYLRESVYVSGECWDKYRIHPNSAMAVAHQQGRYRSTRLFFLKWFEKYLDEHNVDDAEIRLALKKAFWPYKHPFLSTHPRLYKMVARVKRAVTRKS